MGDNRAETVRSRAVSVKLYGPNVLPGSCEKLRRNRGKPVRCVVVTVTVFVIPLSLIVFGHLVKPRNELVGGGV
jgi:hypothetical protein